MVQLKVRRVYESGPVQGFMAVMIMAVRAPILVKHYDGQNEYWSKTQRARVGPRPRLHFHDHDGGGTKAMTPSPRRQRGAIAPVSGPLPCSFPVRGPFSTPPRPARQLRRRTGPPGGSRAAAGGAKAELWAGGSDE